MASRFIVNGFSESVFGFGLTAVFTCLAAFPHLVKNSVDGPAASGVLVDFELMSQSIQIFGAHTVRLSSVLMLVEVERNFGFTIQVGYEGFAVFAGTQVRYEVGAPAHSL